MESSESQSEDPVMKMNESINQQLNRSSEKRCDAKQIKSEVDLMLKMLQKLPPECKLEDLQVDGMARLCLLTSSQLAILSKVKKLWQVTEELFHRAELPLPSTGHQFAEFFRLDATRSQDGERHTGHVNLLSISNLLEVECIIPEWLELHTELLADILLAELKSASVGDTSTNDPFLISKVLMQLCQLQPDKVCLWSKRREEDDRTITEYILSGLLRMTCGKGFSSETCHMSSLALITFLRTVRDGEGSLIVKTITLLEYLHQGTDSNFQESRILLDGHPMCIPQLPHLSQPEYVFGICCYCRAVLKVLDGRLLLSLENGPCVIERILGVICSLQDKKRGTEYQYILLITTWFEASVHHISKNQPRQPSDVFWASLERLSQQMWCEISSPVAGAQEQLMKAYQALISMLHIEVERGNHHAIQMHQRLLQSVLSAPFHIKARYLIAGSIIQFFGFREVLNHRPEFAEELMKCLDTNHLRSVAELVYRQAIIDLKKQLGEVGEELLTEWKRIWSDRILMGLCSETSLSRSHVCSYFISHTLKIIPGSLPMLLSSLETLSGVTDARKLHASMMILKQAKMKGLLKECEMTQYESILQAGLGHLDDDIRSDAFGLLVHSWHSCQPFSGKGLRQLRDFIFDNLDSDNTAFRNNFITGVKNALYRMRGSSPSLIRKLTMCNSEDNVSDPDRDEMQRRLVEIATVLDEVFEKCLSSLFPGACYQRVRSALDIFTHLFQCFMKNVGDNKKEKKGISEEMKLELLRQIQTDGKCQFISARSASLLLPCLLKSSDDLRTSAYYLLTAHFPWPLPHCDAYPWPEPTEILCLGMKLISSPRVQDCESGALLCKMSFTRNIIEKNMHMREVYPEKTFEEPIRKSKGKSAESAPPIFPPKHTDPEFHFLHSLLDSLKFQVGSFQENALDAAAMTPMYGLVIALTQCVIGVPESLSGLHQENLENARAFIKELLATLHRVCRFILNLLSGRIEDADGDANVPVGRSPSFNEMTVAITKMMTSLNHQFDGGQGGDLVPSSSLEHQLIFSCCWLTLKHCSYLLSQISAKICQSKDIQSLMEEEQHVTVATILVDILVQCRHKGVIETCAAALSSLCSAFLDSAVGSDLQEHVQTLLEMTLDLLVGRESSYTKQSAGLPMLVEAIVTAEPRQRERKLLKLAITRLLRIAKMPLPEESSEKQDVPQAHALNILGSLFRASVTAEDIGLYLSDVLQFTIRGFASPCFVLRNCCMQLFGVLIARLFGQKKVTDEHSFLNSLSVEEFLSRHRDMKDYLLSEVGAAAEDLKSQGSGSLPIRPSLQPVLVVLSRLGPGIEGQYDEGLSKPFRDALLVLLSSPIYFVRRLVPRASLAFIPPPMMVGLMRNLIRGLPASPTEQGNHNKIHGELLLIGELIKSGQVDKESILEVADTLSGEPSWIGQDSNHCACTRAAYINVLRTAITRTCLLSEDVKNISRTIIEQCLQQVFLYQIGASELCDAVIGLAFESSKIGSHQNTLLSKILVRLLAHPSQDLRLAAIKYSQDNLLAFPGGEDLRIVTESVFHCVMTETSHTNLSESLNLCYSLCLRARESSMNWDVPQWHALYSLVLSLANGSRGTLLCACSLPVLSCLCSVDSTRCGDINWHEWVSLFTSYCQPSQSETLRFAVVRSLNVAAGKCFAALSRSGTEGDAASAVSLLQCIYKLLQDEQFEIRQDTAAFVNDLISGNSSESKECCQVNHMLQYGNILLILNPHKFPEGLPNSSLTRLDEVIQELLGREHKHTIGADLSSDGRIFHCGDWAWMKMILYFCDEFGQSRSVLDLLFTWLQGPSGDSVRAMQEQLNVRPTSLFEQISSNIYKEQVIEADFLAAGLEAFICKKAEHSPEFVKSWLEGKYKISVKELKCVTEALGKISLVDGSFFGVTGFMRPYQSVYKVLRSLLLLHSVSRRLGMMEALEIHRIELKEQYECIGQMHDIHPLLQDGRLLSLFDPAPMTAASTGALADAVSELGSHQGSNGAVMLA